MPWIRTRGKILQRFLRTCNSIGLCYKLSSSNSPNLGNKCHTVSDRQYYNQWASIPVQHPMNLIRSRRPGCITSQQDLNSQECCVDCQLKGHSQNCRRIKQYPMHTSILAENSWVFLRINFHKACITFSSFGGDQSMPFSEDRGFSKSIVRWELMLLQAIKRKHYRYISWILKLGNPALQIGYETFVIINN